MIYGQEMFCFVKLLRKLFQMEGGGDGPEEGGGGESEEGGVEDDEDDGEERQPPGTPPPMLFRDVFEGGFYTYIQIIKNKKIIQEEYKTGRLMIR